jgi:signal transduction histidine kinase
LALGAAHEINNPLLGILSHFELEQRRASDDEARAEIEQCIEAARRISTTLRGLLSYARPGPLQLSKVDLDQLVSDTFAFLQAQPLFRGKKLEKVIAPDLPSLTADANQVSQVLMNLLLNAADATPEGGAITVTAELREPGDKIEIRVSDTGGGIPPEVLPHVFDPFFTTKRGRGTGLGLSITQAYLRSHRGNIQIESQPGRGTTVRVTLPVAQQARAAVAAPEVVS